MPEQCRQLDGHRGGDGNAHDDESLGASGARRRIGVVWRHHQLLPQPLGVRSCELARQRVETAHALDGDEERFIPDNPLSVSAAS